MEGANLKIALILASIPAGAAAALMFGANRWKRETEQLRARLRASRETRARRIVDFRQLDGLPTPVDRYFRRVLKEGRPVVTGVRVRHKGSFNMGETARHWKPFTSDQLVVTRRPGFDWDARVAVVPGLTIRVHDAYVAGEGILHAALFGLFSVASLRGTREVAEGELMRFFAEAAWFPTALLPNEGVQWSEVDSQSARATLVDGDLSVTMLFRFDQTGLIDSVRADARGRTVGGRIIPTAWEGRFWNYEERDGMRVPLEGEVAWLLPDGPQPYWRGRITQITYDFPG